MAEWQAKLDAFLRLNDGEVLANAGRVSAARAKAARELAKYGVRREPVFGAGEVPSG